MKIIDYIRGSRRGKEAHRIEFEAMQDPFLADALKGYDRTDADDASRRIDAMRQKVQRRARRASLEKALAIAACLAALITLGGQFVHHFTSDHADSIAYTEPAADADAFMYDEMELPAAEPLAEYAKSSDIQAQKSLAKDAWPGEGPKPLTFAHRLAVPAAVPFVDMPLDEEPSPVPGKKAYWQYIDENLSIPAVDECGGVRGAVTVAFRVNAMGRPYGFDVRQSLCPTADREALRLIFEGPAWTPGDKVVNLTIRF